MKKWLEKIYRLLGIKIDFATHNYIVETDSETMVVWACDDSHDSEKYIAYYMDVHKANGEVKRILAYTLPENGYRVRDKTKDAARKHLAVLDKDIRFGKINITISKSNKAVQDYTPSSLRARMLVAIHIATGALPNKADENAYYYTNVGAEHENTMKRIAKMYYTTALKGDKYSDN